MSETITIRTLGLEEVLRALSAARTCLNGARVKAAWKQGGAALVRAGRANLKRGHTRTGEMGRSLYAQVRQNGRSMLVGFRKAGTQHAGWAHAADLGHAIKTGGRVKPTLFWSDVRTYKTAEAARIVRDGILIAVKDELD